MLIRILLAMLIPFAASATTTPVLDFTENGDSHIYRQTIASDPDLPSYITTEGDSFAICTHLNWSPPGNEIDPSILMQITSNNAGGGNGFMRFHVDEDGDALAFRGGHGVVDEQHLFGQIIEGDWYTACAVVRVVAGDVGGIPNLTFQVMYQNDNASTPSKSTPLAVGGLDFSGPQCFAIGKGRYDDDSSGDADGYCETQVHKFYGLMAATLIVDDPTDQELDDYLDGQDPDVIWGGVGRKILQPDMDAVAATYDELVAQGGTGDPWIADQKTSCCVDGGFRTFTEPDGPAQYPTLLGVTLSWLEDLWMKLQTAGVPDAH
jgi:hypothetical protein